MVLFNRYEYNPQTDLAGRGKFARVYKALDKELNTPVALKIWKTGGEGAAPFIPADDRQKLISLSHPNIGRYLAIEDIEKEDAFGETEKIQVCALEWLAGGTLGQYYQSHKEAAILEKLLPGLINGLSYLHQNGIAHQGIKASNILIQETTEGYMAKLTDFGIPGDPGIDATTAYRTDFQSLGSLIYEIFTGDSALPQGKDILTGDSILSPEKIEKLRQLPQPLRDLVSQCFGEPTEQPGPDDTQLLDPGLKPASSDDTQLLPSSPKPAPSDDTQLLTPARPSSDDTQLLTPRPTPSDDTQLLNTKPKPANQTPTPLSSDDTQLLGPGPKPASSDDTQLLTPARPSSDDTQLLTPRPTPSDDTQLLNTKPKPANQTPTPLSSDDTQLLGPGPKPASSDDTQLLNTTSKPKPTPSDDTQFLQPRKEESLSLFNRYEYNPHSGLIGKGGFSRVYKAFDKKLNRWVALKIYKGGEFGDRYSAIAEIRRVVNLDHSNICRYLDIEEIEKDNSFGEKEITQICVMELLDGGNFAQYYNTHKDDKVLKKLLNDVLNGLSYLHKNGIIHRDIKPANILIKETIDGPVAKITDFGISKISDSINNNSSSALIVSIPYMAPEQLNVKKYGINEKISYNLDLWSLGVTIYEIVTGKVLFKNNDQDSSEQIMTNIMAPELPEKIQELSQPFRDIVSHCIVKNAKDRAQKAEELIVLLHGNYDTAPTKTSFFIDNDKDEAAAGKTNRSGKTDRSKTGTSNGPIASAGPGRKTEREKKIIFISLIASFIIVFAAITLYFHTKGNKKEDLSTGPAKIADSTTTISAPSVKAPAQVPATAATQPAAAETQQPSSPAKTDSSPANQPRPATAERRPKKATSDNEKREAPVANGSTQKYVLLLTTTQSCTVSINKEDYGKLEAGKTLKVFLVPGNYVLQATSLSNSASVYTGNLEVSERNRNEVGQYKIPLP